MRKIAQKFKIAGIIILPLFFCACLSIQIVSHVQDPGYYFSKAYSQIERIHRQYPSREGRAHRLYILVLEDAERKLVRLSVPIWLVNACLSFGLKAAESNHELDEINDRYDIDWKAIKDIGQFGPGLLVEVDDERDKVLIWLK